MDRIKIKKLLKVIRIMCGRTQAKRLKIGYNTNGTFITKVYYELFDETCYIGVQFDDGEIIFLPLKKQFVTQEFFNTICIYKF